MAVIATSSKLNSEGPPRRIPSVPMRVAGGNSPIDKARVVFVGSNDHGDPTRQRAISTTLGILPQPGDVVLTEGEPLGKALNSSWVPEMAGVDTDVVTLRGWEDAGLYDRAKGVVGELTAEIQMLNALSAMGLGQWAGPLIDGLVQKIHTDMADMDEVVLHQRTQAMKASVMDILGSTLQEGGTLFVYAGAAHLDSSELGGLNGIPHVVLEV